MKYVAWFKTEILSLAHPNESQKDLIWLFCKELPYVMRGLFVTSMNLNSVEVVLQEVLGIQATLIWKTIL